MPYTNHKTQTGPNTQVSYNPAVSRSNIHPANHSPQLTPSNSNKSNISTQTAENLSADNPAIDPNQNTEYDNLQSDFELTPAHDNLIAQDEDFTNKSSAPKHQISAAENNAHASAPLGNMTPLSASPPHSPPPVVNHIQSPPGDATKSQPEEGYLPPLSATPPHTSDKHHQVNGVDAGLDDLERRRLEELYR